MCKNSTFLICLSILILSTFLSSCGGDFQKSESGVLYKTVATNGTDTKPQDDQYLLLDILLTTPSDSILYSSREIGRLLHMKYDTYAQKLMKPNPLNTFFFHMSKGDSVHFKVRPEDQTLVNPNDTKADNEYFYGQVRLVDILDYPAYRQWQMDQSKRRMEAYNRDAREQAAREAVAIDSLLNAQKKQYQISSSGIRYIVQGEGEGPYPKGGDSLFYTYEVSYLNGEVLPGELGRSGKKPMMLVMGSESTIQSWQESLMLLRAGESGTFYIPPALGLGNSESFGIKPNVVLVANIKLLDIRN